MTEAGSRLHRFARQLESMPSGRRAEPDGGYLAYLDFSDVFEPDGRQVEETFRNLARKEPSDKLSCPGWIGFFGYEFLAAHLGLSSGESGPCHTRWLVRTPENGYPSSSRCNPRRIGNPGRGVKSPTYSRKRLSLPAHRASGQATPFVATLSSANTKDGLQASPRGHTRRRNLSNQDFPTIRGPSSNRTGPGFQRLCLANPAPEAFLLRTENFSILSCSPKR